MALTTRTRLAAGGTAVLLLAGGTTAALALPANADKVGSCAGGGARYDVDVEREDGGYEVSLDLDNAARGSDWRITLRHDGKRVANVVRTADREGEVELDRWRPNTSGSDTFTVRAKRLDRDVVCTATITRR